MNFPSPSLFFLAAALLLVACDEDATCIETTWYEDADDDGLGNPDAPLAACAQPAGYVADNTDTDDAGGGATLHPAFAAFDSSSYVIFLDGGEVVLETDGYPNHTSPYWSSTNERTTAGPNGGTRTTPAVATDHPLFVEPTVTTYAQMAPGNIDDFTGSFTLRVPANPQLASVTSATGLGPIGLAVSGSVIYNDREGPNVPLDNAAASLDYTGAHTGPQSYHYHLEPKAWSEDDDALIGIISDGFFLYGRKCHATGDYPADLDDSGGHESTTQYASTAEYHYHIQNELYADRYYILFPGNYQGSPNAIQ